MFILRWLISRTFRQAVDFRRQVRRYAKAQEDILTEEQIKALDDACNEITKVLDTTTDKKLINEALDQFEKTANKNIRPYPNSSMRENIDVILVAVTVAFAVRTFFLQPFKIPTGSMQPTLYGITFENLKETGGEIPTGFAKFVDRVFYGNKYVHVVAEEPGYLEQQSAPQRKFLLFKKQVLTVGGRDYDVWETHNDLLKEAGLDGTTRFEKGDDIIKVRIKSGDHLFVNRFTYNWRPPTRGEIIVFKTEGIEGLQQDQFYIKRLVGLPGEELSIGDDLHTRINGERLNAATEHFEYVYSYDLDHVEDNVYLGHVNGNVGSNIGKPYLSPLLYSGKDSYQIKEGHFMVLGDNTRNSLDSRAWGDFTRTNVIGQSAFVYWPISERFGWSHR